MTAERCPAKGALDPGATTLDAERPYILEDGNALRRGQLIPQNEERHLVELVDEIMRGIFAAR